MIQKLTFAVNSNDDILIQNFLSRLLLANIQAKILKSSDKYSYIDITWNDSDINLPLKLNSRNAGAKAKILHYNNSPVTCGLIYKLRNEQHLSDAQIAALLNVSESTICRRRKKHFSDGCFYEGSKTIF